MGYRLNWDDNNLAEDGHRVYRSTSEMDPNNLPEPLAVLGPDVTTYEDTTAEEGTVYHYRVSAFKGESEAVSLEVMTEVGEVTGSVEFAGAGDYLSFISAAGMTLSPPPGAQVGDLLLACLMYRSTLTVPAGWKLEVVHKAPDPNFEQWTAVYSKYASEGDIVSGSVWGVPAAGRLSGQTLGFRNYVPNGGPVMVKAINSVEGANVPYTNIPIANVTVPSGGAKAVSVTSFTLATTGDTSDAPTALLPLDRWAQTSPLFPSPPEMNNPARLCLGYSDVVSLTSGHVEHSFPGGGGSTNSASVGLVLTVDGGGPGPELPTEIGEEFGGGYYIGNIVIAEGGPDDGEYAIIMGGLDSQPGVLQWKTPNTATARTDSRTDGKANTLAMETAGLAAHPAANYCLGYAGGGHSDWYLPARDELALAWTNRGQLAALAMEAQIYWSSTQGSATTAWYLRFSNGLQTTINKDGSYRVRPVRRLKI